MGGTDEPDMYKRGCGGKTTGHTEMSVGNRSGGKYGAGYRQVAETAGDLPDFYKKLQERKAEGCGAGSRPDQIPWSRYHLSASGSALRCSAPEGINGIAVCHLGLSRG